MNQHPSRTLLRGAMSALLLLCSCTGVGAAEKLSFNRDIRPILSDNCFHCHGPDSATREGSLRLDEREPALKGGESELPAIVPGKPEKSELLARVIETDPTEKMPPKKLGKTLSSSQVETLRRWIREGAEYDAHWAFLPPQRTEPPTVSLGDKVVNAVDQFILARLAVAGLKPSPEADKATLLRRVTLDLTGLPPTLEEIKAFAADVSSEAYERVVDRLLASPRYGERMALQWLDFARYADSNGFQSDGSRQMWRWREWVIKAFNDNMPFDRFTIEQLAGDLLPNPTVDQLVATGFNRNHRLNGEAGRIVEEWFAETVIDRVETTGNVWLGLTVGCARCHDHKFDPITQKEFYQLFAFFNSCDETGVLHPEGKNGVNTDPVLYFPTPEHTAEQARLEAVVKDAEERLATIRAGNSEDSEKDAREVVIKARKALKDYSERVPSTMIMREGKQPRPAFVLQRGQYDQPGEKVERGVPAFLPPLPPGAPVNRLGLAQWIVSPQNPLTARVWVNRAWEKFFGVGLVKTSENFGSQAEWPSHPELLDWLATEFVRLGWDMKALQKTILMSATYRQSARVTPELLERDPENRLLARGPRFRLPAELLRDSALAVSGLLVEKLGGPSVRPYMPKGVWDETSVYGDLRNYQHAKDDGLYRRTLYTIWKRTAAPPTALLFDAPNREICTVKRSTTNTPLQALALLNEVTFVEAARKLAERMILEGGVSVEERLRWAFVRVTAREPQPQEIEILRRGLERQFGMWKANAGTGEKLITFGDSKPDGNIPPHELAAYTVAANVLLNLDEFVTR